MRPPFLHSLCAVSIFFTLAVPVASFGRQAPGLPTSSGTSDVSAQLPTFRVMSHPREGRLRRGHAFDNDLRTLPQVPPQKFERPEFEEPNLTPIPYPGTSGKSPRTSQPVGTGSPTAPAPAPTSSFEGLDFTNWGAGHPPDTNGDVGPQYYVQTINTSVGIYNKSDGSRVTAFVFNTLMSQGNFGNLCDTANFGDPVVLYDTFEDRWILTDFAFNLSGGNAVAPEYQCFAVSKSGDPVAGGWNFYSIQVSGGLGDYPKLGIWPDGLYMSANIFSFGAGSSFQNVRVWALNKSQMYAGLPTVQVLSFDAPSAEFTLLPSNARLQTGTPPANSPNYFSVVAQFLNTVSVYKLHADWKDISTSTFSGPSLSLTSTSWSQLLAANQSEQSPGNKLDTLYFRLMMQNQYTNIGGLESLWNSHTVGATGATSAQAAVRYYQVDVTGGTVASNATQAFTYSPDATVFRFMPSVGVDRVGNMAIGYSATNATLNPAIRYAGRLAGDPVNTITQTEQSLIEGTGTQSGNCGSSCTRWGDYSAMTLDPDGCTFWYTNMYYQTTGLAFNTRVGAFSFPSCTPIGSGMIEGTVTAAVGGAPIQGAAIALGSRATTTDVNGNYTFSGLPAGTYPGITASYAGYASSTVSSIVVTDGGVTVQDFALSLAGTSGCITDTSQADFLAGVPTNCDLTTSPGDATLTNSPAIDQQNTTIGNSGVGITITTWGGQTFTPSVTGQLTRADINLFCSGCTGTKPNLTLSLRATSAGLPTGVDLASATITGFSSGAAVFYTANFASPPTLTAGTQYAIVIRPTANPSPGTYALTRSGTSTLGANVYPGGTRVSGATSGTVWSIPTTGGVTTDAGFNIFMQTGFAPSGTFISSLKDANPALNTTATWSTISWNADTPTGTSVNFQVAASNDPSGPFTFVGPDNTSGTFFSDGGSLAQFNGNRYLKYQASLITNSNATTPTLHDVTVCFEDVVNALGTALTVVPATASYGATVSLSATLTAGSTGVSGKPIDFTLIGASVGSATTDSSGIATMSNVSLAGISAGNYPTGIAATFAGDSGYASSTGNAGLTVSSADQTITFGVLSSKSFGDPDFTVSATASSGLVVAFSAGGSCTVTASTVHLTGAGSCTITASQSGDSNYNPAPDVSQAFSISKADQTISFGALPSKTFGDPDLTVSATASSTLVVSFSAGGSCTVTGSTVHLTGAGSCTITASQAGDSDYNPAPNVPQTFLIAKDNQTITFGALANKNFGDADFGVSATASSGLTVAFAASANCSVAASTVHLTGAGSCTITASQAGDSNYNPASDVPQTFSIAKGNQTITFDALANKTFGNPDYTISASASSGLTVGFSSTGNCSVTGSTVHLSGAGSCTITASQGGDSNYNLAPQVQQSLTINKATPLVDVSCTPVGFDTNTHACTAAVTGIGNVVVTGVTTFTYNGNPALPANAGTYSVDASFASGDGNYVDATGSSSLAIAKAIPSVTVQCPLGIVYDGNAHACGAIATGIGNVTVRGSSVLTYNGGPPPSAGGTYGVSASFASSDSNYSDTTGIGSLTIAKASQTITFGAVGDKLLGDPDFNVSATASSALAVSFSASGTCTVIGSTVQLTGAGTCTITASQSGDTNYSPAANVPRSFVINHGNDFTITATLPAVTVKAGQSVTDHITITPNPLTLSALTFTCSGLPANASCTFAPNPVPAGWSPTDVVMTITTSGSSASTSDQSRLFYAAWFGFTGMGMVGIVVVGVRRKSQRKIVVLGAFTLLLLLTVVGCGAHPETSGTLAGTSTVTVTGSTSSFTHSTTISLTVN